MSQKAIKKPLAIALGTVFVTSLAGTPVANAAENPFAMSDMSGGYMVAEKGEGKCGGSMDKGGMDKDKMKEGKCGESHKEMKEGKCGEGMSGDMAKEGMDKSKMKKEGKCGEGKCGGSK